MSFFMARTDPESDCMQFDSIRNCIITWWPLRKLFATVHYNKNQIVYVQNNHSKNAICHGKPKNRENNRALDFDCKGDATSREDMSLESLTLSNPIYFSNPFFSQTFIFALKKTTRKNGEKMLKQKLSFNACITIWESFLKRETSLVNILTIFVPGQNIAITIIYTLCHSLAILIILPFPFVAKRLHAVWLDS
jgi:hypothetical protein